MLFGLSLPAWAQTHLTWDQLAEVEYEARFFEKYDQKFLVPLFGKTPKAYEGKEVTVTGYIIPIDETSYVLSKNPYAACFFCGSAGPETVVELQLKPKSTRRYKMDEKMTFKGILKLNDTDVEHFTYIIEKAKPVSK